MLLSPFRFIWLRSIAALTLTLVALPAEGETRTGRRAHPSVKRPVGLERVVGQERAVQIVRELLIHPIVADTNMRHLLPSHTPTRGLLFVGPKRVGKTLASKALAEELRVVHEIPPEHVHYQPYEIGDLLGESTRETVDKINAMFDEAGARIKAGAKRAVLYIDEIDGLLGKRGSDSDGRTRAIVAAFNSALDGNVNSDRITLIASTNHANSLDDATRAAGRFDVEVPFTLPDLRARHKILENHTLGEGVPLARDVDLERLARDTPGFSGGDLRHLVERMTVKANQRIIADHPELKDDKTPSPQQLARHSRVEAPDVRAARGEVEPSGLRAHRVEPPTVEWSDIVGIGPAVAHVEHLVKLAKGTGLKRRYRTQPASVLLLIGLQGGGKTMLAQAAAHEMGANLLAIRGSDVRESLYGESPRNLRERLDLARQQRSLLFIDEIDTVAPATGTGGPTEPTETDAIGSELLAGIEGFQRKPESLLILATNRPWALDPRLIDRVDGGIVHVPMIGPAGREALAQKWLKDQADGVAAEVTARRIAKMTALYSGRRLTALLHQTGRVADMANADVISDEHFARARKLILPSVTVEEIRETYSRFEKFTSLDLPDDFTAELQQIEAGGQGRQLRADAY